jgi:hypothetical protein
LRLAPTDTKVASSRAELRWRGVWCSDGNLRSEEADPISRRRNGHSKSARELAHCVVARKEVAEEARKAVLFSPVEEALEQQRRNAVPLPFVGDCDRELGLAGRDHDVASIADNFLTAPNVNSRDQCKVCVVIDVGETVLQGGREFA